MQKEELLCKDITYIWFLIKIMLVTVFIGTFTVKCQRFWDDEGLVHMCVGVCR